MGWWEDLTAWINTQINNVFNWILQGVIDAINWCTENLKAVRAQLTATLMQLMSTPGSAALTILGTLLAVVALEVLWNEIQKITWVKAITTFLTGLADTIKSIASMLQIDTILAVVRLGAVFVEDWQKSLSKIYEALGSLSMELERGFGYINTFLEVDRVLIGTAYTLSGNSWVKREAAYAEGLSVWLGKVQGRMGVYAANPEQIFIDIQKEVGSVGFGEQDKEVGRIWAAIDLAGSWIENKAGVLIKMFADLDVIVNGLPPEVKTALDTWYTPFHKVVTDFIDGTWAPFWADYKSAKGIIETEVSNHGVSIK